jgi:hypothetical protein
VIENAELHRFPRLLFVRQSWGFPSRKSKRTATVYRAATIRAHSWAGLGITPGTLMAERRKIPRQRTFKGGTIAFNQRFSSMDCLVRNLTAKGAMLKLASSVGIPDHFELKLEHDKFRTCHVVWRREDALGIEFE